MPVITTLSDVPEQTTKAVTMAFEDEDGQDVVPNSLVWSLYNEDGDIVNDKEDVEIETPAATVTIAVYGDDLVYTDGRKRRVVVTGTYDSTLGSDLPLVGIAEFNLVRQAY